jgi:hypothetical protein
MGGSCQRLRSLQELKIEMVRDTDQDCWYMIQACGYWWRGESPFSNFGGHYAKILNQGGYRFTYFWLSSGMGFQQKRLLSSFYFLIESMLKFIICV